MGPSSEKEVVPMVQFLLDVASQVLATVLAALILRHFFRG